MADEVGERKEESGGEEDEEMMPGFRFKPNDWQLVEYYLLPRLQGRPAVPNPAIIEANVYQLEPKKLINEKCKNTGEVEWYFLSPRDRKYPNGSRPSRHTLDRAGRWKASSGKKEISETVYRGGFRFCVSSLAYFKGPVGKEKKTGWLMREYTIPQFEIKLNKSGAGADDAGRMLDEYVLCKIYLSRRVSGRVDEEEEGSASMSVSGGPVEAVEVAAAGAVQAGKRPVEEDEKTLGLATAPKRPCLPRPTPAFGPCDGQQAPMPWPTQAMGNGQVPMQKLSHMHNCTVTDVRAATLWPMLGRQPASPMYRGHAPVQHPLPAYHNHSRMLRPPTNNGQAPTMQRPAMRQGQAPPMQRLPMNNVQAPTMQQPAMRQGQAPPMQRLPMNNVQAPPVQRPPMSNVQAPRPMQRPPMNNVQAPPTQRPSMHQGQGTPTQRPPMNNGQAPTTQRPLMNNHRPPTMHRPPVHNGPAPVQRRPFYNGHAPMHRQATMYNGEAPMQRRPAIYINDQSTDA